MFALEQNFKQRVWYVLCSTLLLGSAITVFVLASSFVLVIIAGIILAVLSLCLIKFLQRKLRLPRWGSFILAWLLIVGVPIALVALTLPNLQSQFADFGARFSLEEVPESWTGDIPGFDFIAEEISPEDLTAWLQESALSGQVGGIALSAVTALVSLFLLLFIGIYGSFDPARYKRQSALMIPPNWFLAARRHFPILETTLSYWIIGRLLSMVVIAVLTYFGLLAIGVELAFLLAVLAGLLSFIPNIGPVLSVIPAVIVALTQDVSLVIWVLGLYLCIQAVESYLITPFIQQWSVNIPPAALLITQALLGVLFGIIGILLAEPILALIIAYTAVRAWKINSSKPL